MKTMRTSSVFTGKKGFLSTALCLTMLLSASLPSRAQWVVEAPALETMTSTNLIYTINKYIQDMLHIEQDLANWTTQLETAGKTFAEFDKYAKWAKTGLQYVNAAVKNYQAIKEIEINYNLLKGDYEMAVSRYNFYKNATYGFNPIGYQRGTTINPGNLLSTSKYTIDLITSLIKDATIEFEFIQNVVGAGKDGRAIWELDAGERLELIRQTNRKLRGYHETFQYVAGLLNAQQQRSDNNAAKQKLLESAFSISYNYDPEVEGFKFGEIVKIADNITGGTGSSTGTGSSGTQSGSYTPYSSTLTSVNDMFREEGTVAGVFDIVLYGIMILGALLAPLAYMRFMKGEVQHRDALFNLVTGFVAMILIVQVVRVVLFGS